MLVILLLCWGSNTTAENRQSTKIFDKKFHFDVVFHSGLQVNR